MCANESSGHELVEDGDTAEGTAGPFGLVFLELGVDGLQEGTNEGHLEGRASNGALGRDVADCAWLGGRTWQLATRSTLLTLIICDGEGQQREENGPGAGVGDGLDHVVDLGRDIDIAKLGIGQHRGEGSRVGLHGCGRIRGGGYRYFRFRGRLGGKGENTHKNTTSRRKENGQLYSSAAHNERKSSGALRPGKRVDGQGE